MRICIGFALLRATLSANQRQKWNQSRSGRMRFPALEAVCLVLVYSSHWFLIIFSFVLIGFCDNFGFGFPTLNRIIIIIIL